MKWIRTKDRLPTKEDSDHRGCVLVSAIDELGNYKVGPYTRRWQEAYAWMYWAPLPPPKVIRMRKVKVQPGKWALADAEGELLLGKMFLSKLDALKAAEQNGYHRYIHPVELTGEFEIEEED
jgi:hypothetical protein